MSVRYMVHWGRFRLRTGSELSGQKNNIVDMLLISVVFQDSQHLLTGSQFNFSIYKYKHYRWQKRILQVTSKILTFEEIHKK